MTFVSSLEIDASEYKLGLSGLHQKINAILAKVICLKWIEHLRSKENLEINDKDLDHGIIQGLELAKWPGRSQVYTCPEYANVRWMLDGAHTDESMVSCVEWFKTTVKTSNKR